MSRTFLLIYQNAMATGATFEKVKPFYQKAKRILFKIHELTARYETKLNKEMLEFNRYL